MRSAIAPSKLEILVLILCIKSCVSFQLSYLSRSRQIQSCCLQQQKSAHPRTPTSTQSGSVIHHHCRLPSSQLFLAANSEDNDGNSSNFKNNDDDNSSTQQPLLLQPYLPAMDPNYSTHGPVGLNKFILSRDGPPTIEELSNEQMLRIVKLESSDLEVNTLVWKCLGYRFNNQTKSWSNNECFPKWREQFPAPPDLIGMKRVYSREVDSPSLRSNQALVRSIPMDNKQSLKTHLKPLGWKGYQYNELTPNKTRRAQCANWLIYYREELFGYTIEELSERRRLKREAAAKLAAEEEEEAAVVADVVVATQNQDKDAKVEDDWKPPVKEVF